MLHQDALQGRANITVFILPRLECDVGAHCERVELRADIADIGCTHLLGDVAVKAIEHEPDVAVDVQVQTRRVDGLFSARHAIRGCQLIVEIDHTD
jgi:hypothetical protein